VTDGPQRAVASLHHVVEALLFVATEPLPVARMAEAAGATPEAVERTLADLADRYREGRSGVVLERVAQGWGLRAAVGAAEACARLVDRAPDRALTGAALETLAVIAYAGPVSRPEIARIRGVSADAAVAGLEERGLVEEAGRADRPGAPVLYRTTSTFERVFGLEEGLASLPPLDDLTPADSEPSALRARLQEVAASS
jgi:segregation and condensation protein B